jgi:hypothetical protein
MKFCPYGEVLFSVARHTWVAGKGGGVGCKGVIIWMLHTRALLQNYDLVA